MDYLLPDHHSIINHSKKNILCKFELIDSHLIQQDINPPFCYSYRNIKGRTTSIPTSLATNKFASCVWTHPLWRHQMETFSAYWPFVRGIHRSPVNSAHKGQWRGALMFSLICARINGWVKNREAGDLRRHRAHYDVIVMRKDSATCAIST